MNRLLLIIAGLILMTSGAITAALGFAQYNHEDTLDERAATECKSDETLVRTTKVNPDGGGLLTVYYCQDEDKQRREIQVSDEATDDTSALVILAIGLGMTALGLVMLTIGAVRKSAESTNTPGFEQFTPVPMTVSSLPGGGTVVTSNVVMVNGQQVDPNSDMAQMIQQALGAMNMAFDQMDQGAGIDVGGLLQMALQQLDAAHAAGTISEEDYQKARQKIMENKG